MVSIVITRQTTWQPQMEMATAMEHGARHEWKMWCGCHHFGNAREATQKRV